MTVFRTYVKRVVGRPWMIALTVAIPVLILVIVGAGGSGNAMRVALIDHDDTLLSRMVIEAVAPVATFVEVEEEEITSALVDGRIEYALVMPAGMQQQVIAGGRARVDAYSLQGVEMTRTVRSAADAVLSAAHNVARVVDGERDAFVAAMEGVRGGRFAVQTETYRSERGALGASEAAGLSQLMGLLTMTMLFLAMTTCLMFLSDIEKGTFHRTLAGPLSVRRYMLETNAAFFCATVLQAVAGALVLAMVFPQLSAEAVFSAGAILTAFAMVAVSFTLAVANTMKTVRRTGIATNFLIMPMVMLGGAFWPFEIMPDYLQRVGTFSPTRWATSATAAVLSGAPFTEIVPHLGVLVLFAVVFQLLGSWRRVDVAK